MRDRTVTFMITPVFFWTAVVSVIEVTGSYDNCNADMSHIFTIFFEGSVLVTFAKGVHPVPSRTRQLSPSAPMVVLRGESRSSPEQFS